MDLSERFKQYIKKENLFHPGDRLLLAVSGGVDSVALCELCKQAGYEFEIAHCNFKLREQSSDDDEAFVKALAERHEVVFHHKTFDTSAWAKVNKQSIEEAARELRYTWFRELITKPGDGSIKYVVTGHHADDNIETVVMNFFRGTGITGLRGILPKQGSIVRPLLFARRSELEAFVKNNGVPFVTDHTNLENDYTRNYFRNTIIPLINKSFPEAEKNVWKNIQRFGETELLYQQAVQLHKKRLLEQNGNEIHIPVLKLLKTVPLPTIVFEIIKEFGFTSNQTVEVMGLLRSESGKYVRSSSYRIIRNRGWLIISPNQTTEAANILIEEDNTEVGFAAGVLKIQKLDIATARLSTETSIAMLDAQCTGFPLLLRKWKQGDYFYPLGMQKKKKLSRFFIDQKLSLTQKENTWVIEMNKKIIWIVGKRIDDRFKVVPGTKEILLFHYLPK